MKGEVSDAYHLTRFVEAQQPVYSDVLKELREGRKQSHWMWFVFPQWKGLGRSWMAEKYAIASQNEARAYLEHPLLGARLLECTRLVNAVEGRSIGQILGSPDDMKFRSSMTLFAHVAPEPEPFETALNKYFGGLPDRLTLDRLR